MFTGIIQTIGEVTDFSLSDGDAHLTIAAPGLDFSMLVSGSSIAINGVCLTATELADSAFAADVSGETLACTTLGDFKTGARVNLEIPATPTSLLGGHLVSGHVDGMGRIVERRDDGRSVRFDIEAPTALARYIAAKGSVTIDGVSLTVNAVEKNRFGVNIIPHTLSHTIMNDYAEGTHVNIECDIVARYLERLNGA